MKPTKAEIKRLLEPKILWEGPCAYAVETTKGRCDIVVYASNGVMHVTIESDLPADAKTARTVERLNRYPDKTRAAYALL